MITAWIMKTIFGKQFDLQLNRWVPIPKPPPPSK